MGGVPLGGQLAEEVVDQHDQVVPAVAQRGQLDGDHVEPVEEVGAEVAAADFLLEVAVGCRDDPHVDRDRLGGADRNHLALLQHPQQLDLQRRRHLADLVQEEGAAPRRREESLLVAHRAGEGALHVAEQLALQQVLRQGAAVDRQEGAVGPVREVVDVAGDDLLAGAALALDQDGGIGGRHHLGELEHVGEAARLADGPGDGALVLAADVLLELAVLHPDLAEFAGAPQDREQLVVGERLLDVVEGPRVDRPDRGLERGLRRHQDDRRHRILLLGRLQDVESGDLGHPHVGQHDVVAAGPDLVQPGLATLRRRDLEPLLAEQDPQGVEDAGFVVDDQDRGLLGHAPSSVGHLPCRRMVNVVPFPGAESSVTNPR